MTADYLTQVSRSQEFNSAADETIVSTSSIKLAESTTYLRDIGAGGHLAMRFRCETDIDTITVRFNVILASDATLSSNLLTLASTGVVDNADLVAGAFFDVPIPAVAETLGNGALRQYLGASYTVVGSCSADSQISAGIVYDTTAPKNRAYKTGFTGP
jgi:hypothetical protein